MWTSRLTLSVGSCARLSLSSPDLQALERAAKSGSGPRLRRQRTQRESTKANKKKTPHALFQLLLFVWLTLCAMNRFIIALGLALVVFVVDVICKTWSFAQAATTATRLRPTQDVCHALKTLSSVKSSLSDKNLAAAVDQAASLLEAATFCPCGEHSPPPASVSPETATTTGFSSYMEKWCPDIVRTFTPHTRYRSISIYIFCDFNRASYPGLGIPTRQERLHIREMVLSSERVRVAIEKLSVEKSIPRETLEQRAGKYYQDMAASLSLTMSRVVCWFLCKVFKLVCCRVTSLLQEKVTLNLSSSIPWAFKLMLLKLIGSKLFLESTR